VTEAPRAELTIASSVTYLEESERVVAHSRFLSGLEIGIRCTCENCQKPQVTNESDNRDLLAGL